MLGGAVTMLASAQMNPTDLPPNQMDPRNITGVRYIEINLYSPKPPTNEPPVLPGLPPGTAPDTVIYPTVDLARQFAYPYSDLYRTITIGLESYSVVHYEEFEEVNRVPIAVTCSELTGDSGTRYLTTLSQDSANGLFGAANISFTGKFPPQFTFGVGMLDFNPFNNTLYNYNTTQVLPQGNSGVIIGLPCQYIKAIQVRFFLRAQFEKMAIPVFGAYSQQAQQLAAQRRMGAMGAGASVSTGPSGGGGGWAALSGGAGSRMQTAGMGAAAPSAQQAAPTSWGQHAPVAADAASATAPAPQDQGLAPGGAIPAEGAEQSAGTGAAGDIAPDDEADAGPLENTGPSLPGIVGSAAGAAATAISTVASTAMGAAGSMWNALAGMAATAGGAPSAPPALAADSHALVEGAADTQVMETPEDQEPSHIVGGGGGGGAGAGGTMEVDQGSAALNDGPTAMLAIGAPPDPAVPTVPPSTGVSGGSGYATAAAAPSPEAVGEGVEPEEPQDEAIEDDPLAPALRKFGGIPRSTAGQLMGLLHKGPDEVMKVSQMPGYGRVMEELGQRNGWPSLEEYVGAGAGEGGGFPARGLGGVVGMHNASYKSAAHRTLAWHTFMHGARALDRVHNSGEAFSEPQQAALNMILSQRAPKASQAAGGGGGGGGSRSASSGRKRGRK